MHLRNFKEYENFIIAACSTYVQYSSSTQCDNINNSHVNKKKLIA